MVKKLLLLALCLSFSFSDALDDKIKSFMSAQEYHTHSRLLRIVFKDRSNFYSRGSVDSVKVLSALRSNGLLKLSLEHPEGIIVAFRLDFSSFLAIKAISDSLASLGYNYFVIDEAKNNKEGFSLKIGIDTEYAPDPILLNDEFKKRGLRVVDISKNSNEWLYTLHVKSSTLPDAIVLKRDESQVVSKMLKAYWVEIEDGAKRVVVKSLVGNSWYPKVVFYDGSLNILEVVQKNQESQYEDIEIPKGSKFIKVSDFFGSYNIKNGFEIGLK